MASSLRPRPSSHHHHHPRSLQPSHGRRASDRDNDDENDDNWKEHHRISSRRFQVVGVTLCLVLVLLGVHHHQHDDKSKTYSQPLNIVLLYGDDWRHNALGLASNGTVHTPFLDQLAQHPQSRWFTHNCVTTSVCWISRASLFTGQYLSRHGSYASSAPTWYQRWNSSLTFLLRRHNYHVGHVGKWHFGNWDFVQRQYDWSRLYEGHHWYNNDRGSRVHATKKAQRDAIQFLRERPNDKPFFLTVAFFAPHAVDHEPEQYFPQPKSAQWYQNQTTTNLVTKNDNDNDDDNSWHRMPSFFTDENMGRQRWRMRFDSAHKRRIMLTNYFRLISEVDDACRKIDAELQAQGLVEHTLLVFTTDNGYYHAEHGLADKWYPHAESIRVPLIVRDPRIQVTPSQSHQSIRPVTIDALTLNIDLAPTLLHAAHIPPPASMQGRNLADLYLHRNHRGHKENEFNDYAMTATATTNHPWRTDFYYEHPMLINAHTIPASTAVVSHDFKYITWPDFDGREQLFHLTNDPKEEHDVVQQAEYAPTLRQLRQRHQQWQAVVK